MERIKQDLASYLASATPWKEEQIRSLIEQSKKKEWGLLSFPIFSLTSDFKKEALKWSEKLQASPAPFITKVHAVGGFINFHFTRDYLQAQFNQLFQSQVFTITEKKSETIIIDYSSPNVAKQMNVGHLRATVIGQSIVQISRQMGYQVIAFNHLGDWGTQFGKLMVAYNKWGAGEDASLPLLVDLYVRFHTEAEEDPTLEQEAREAFKRLEAGEKESLKLWKHFVEISIVEYNKIWKRLGVQHDITQGESFYKDMVHGVEQELSDKKILKESEGAQVVFLKKNMPPCLIKKSDGASTYSSRDLASISWRFRELKAHLNIYVAGADHILHFNQLKGVLAQWEPDWDQKTKHLSFGMYRFSGQGKLSTRKGRTISLSQLMDQAVEKVEKVIEVKNPSLKNKKEVAEQVGIGALIFNDLLSDRIKDLDFSWEKVLNFEGDSGPFVQYCHVRCVSILKKAKIDPESLGDPQLSIDPSLMEDLEVELLTKVLEFESKVVMAFQKFKPHILAVYLLELCHLFSRFYSTYRIIDSDKKEFRLQLVHAIRKTLKQGLSLLNIQSPSNM